MPFEAVIACDWSSEQGRKPTPQENRCWLAWGHAGGERSEPEYLPTRLETETRILELLTGPLAGTPTLLGFDFAIGYPLADDDKPVLPVGRELCRMMASMVEDDPSGRNNRFHVAAHLNQIIRQITGADHGPFWGRPKTLGLPDVPMTRPETTGVRKLREVERAARRLTKTKPKSPWQLAGIGSVGGQSIVGLATVHRVLEAMGDRGRLWPFEPASERADEITVAEIYPSLYEEKSPAYWFKDARQVVDTRDALLNHEDRASLTARPAATGLDEPDEGWILGIPSSS
ncbi:MAG: hypothetical protein AAF108_09565 [Planctomycetota bacterium]